MQTDLAWQLLQPATLAPQRSRREQFLSLPKPIRLDAFENYIRGILATNRQQKIHYFREAVRLNPNYTLAMLQLGKALLRRSGVRVGGVLAGRISKG